MTPHNLLFTYVYTIAENHRFCALSMEPKPMKIMTIGQRHGAILASIAKDKTSVRVACNNQ